jgi:hypothetical protein
MAEIADAINNLTGVIGLYVVVVFFSALTGK